MVVVPNTKIVQSNITNYHLPEKELAVLAQIGVNCDSDLGKVEKITREVAKEVLETVPGGVPGFEPFIRYYTFNPSSIDSTVIPKAQEFVDNFLIKHESSKGEARYQEESITISLPIHAVYFKPEPDGRWNKPNPVRER
jgi:small-conductance mechanosensitive channel